MQLSKKRICFIVSQLGTVNVFLKDHILFLSKEFDVYLVGNFSEEDLILARELAIIDCKSMCIYRKVNLFSDIKSVFELRKYFSYMKFHAIHSVTPKAGLITALAGRISPVKNRIHIFTGQVWHTKTGLTKYILKVLDKVIARLDTHILVDGESQRQYLIDNKVIDACNSTVLGKGSISGVNVERFNPCVKIREEQRRVLQLNDKIVFGFLGRLNKDKGINDLFAAFNILCEERTNVHLLIIGFDEENLMATLINYLNIVLNVNLTFYGSTTQPENILQAVDVFCLPSYREGFGTSVLEASCLGIPVICSDTYGVMDAMINGKTGLRHTVRDSKSLLDMMTRLADDACLRKEYGDNGRINILENFSGKKMSESWLKYYRMLD